jgi:hypothetical protein
MPLDPLAQFTFRLPRSQDQEFILWFQMGNHSVVELLHEQVLLGIHAVLGPAILRSVRDRSVEWCGFTCKQHSLTAVDPDRDATRCCACHRLSSRTHTH